MNPPLPGGWRWLLRLAPAVGCSRLGAGDAPATECCGFGWAVWDYDDSFGVRDRRGNPTPVLEGLFPP